MVRFFKSNLYLTPCSGGLDGPPEVVDGWLRAGKDVRELRITTHHRGDSINQCPFHMPYPKGKI